MPLLLSLTLFVIFLLIGSALIAGAGIKMPVLRGWFLAPAIGLAVVILLVTILNQAGLPTTKFARPLLFGLVGMSAAVLLWRRPVIPLRRLAPFVIILLIGLGLVGWPSLELGFDWISYGNDDMANYVLSASRMMHHGFYDAPTVHDLAGGDVSQYLWFLSAAGMVRAGADTCLAFVSPAFGLNPLQAFMPTTLAFGLVQIWALTALVHVGCRRRKVLLLATLLVAVSPLGALGIYYQLFGQVPGIALMLALSAVVMRPAPLKLSTAARDYALPGAVLGSALAMTYPETAPFGGLAAGIYLCWLIFKKRPIFWPQLRALGAMGLMMLVILRHNAVAGLSTLVLQTSGGGGEQNTIVGFPFFLVPSGVARLFGLLQITGVVQEPFNSLLIILGMVLLLASFWVAARQCFQGRPVGFLALVMLLVGCVLFAQENGFGLFKLAMFIQPALMAGLAVVIASPIRLPLRLLSMSALAGLLWLMASSEIGYARGSRGFGVGSYSLLPLASTLGFRPIAAPPATAVVVESAHPAAIKLAALFAGSHDLVTPARPAFYEWTAPGAARVFESLPKALQSVFPNHDALISADVIAKNYRDQYVAVREFWGSRVRFALPPQESEWRSSSVVTVPPQITPFNRLKASGTQNQFLGLVPKQGVENRLTFIHSEKGQHFYFGEPRKISYYSGEPDTYNPAQSWHGMGRFFLFRIEKPTRKIRLHIALSTTVTGEGNTALPQETEVMGKDSRTLGLVGNGAASVFSPPIESRDEELGSFVAVDFHREPYQLRTERTGLMLAFNADIQLDTRWVIGFQRDISAISEEEYERLERPVALTTFPQDLMSRNLEFSGIYEDGWLSPDSWVVLGENVAGAELTIEGELHGIPGRIEGPATLEVQINEEPAQRMAIERGKFTIRRPLDQPRKSNRVAVHFVDSMDLPAPDGRPVGAKLERLEITTAAASSSPSPQTKTALPMAN